MYPVPNSQTKRQQSPGLKGTGRSTISQPVFVGQISTERKYPFLKS
jgi:hypothetical protein